MGWRLRGQQGPIGGILHNRSQRVSHGFTTERPFAGEHLVQHHAKGENVRAPVGCLAHCLLGRHVGGSAHNHAGLGRTHREGWGILRIE